jgi:putative nucleotidyltransferase with HDIG domain
MVKKGQAPRSLLAALAAWAVGVPALLHTFGGNEVQTAPWVHFVVVAAGALIAAVASVGLTVAGARANDGRTVLLGAAFSTMTALLMIHGLATPGIIVGQNGVIALAGAASLPAGGAVLALAAVPAMRRPLKLAPVLAIQAALAAVILLLGAIGLAFPTAVPGVPAAGSAPAIVLLLFGLAFFALIALRAVRTYTLTHRTTDLLVFVGCVWMGWALVPQLIMGYGTLAFYFGHGMELLGITLVGIPAALDLRQGGASRPLVGDLTATELVGAEEAFLGARVRVLMTRLEAKDRSTEEHTRRVAEWAVAIGEQLGLAPGRLRDLALAGLLHDIGKLSTPDAILTKPGRLTDAEMDAIRRHPAEGDQLLRELGYAEQIRRGVRGHHERLDGSGYPDGLRGDALDLETRILAVADVWDALVSRRVYRGAWTPERAMALLVADAGTAFDPRCVEALRAITGVQPDAGATLLAA